MMKMDLAAARKAWIAEATSAEKLTRRQESDFLCYQDENGLFADFHSNRHTFITNLSQAGVRLRTAQSLARHSDIFRLTMGTYTHIGLHDQSTAIEQLPPLAPRENQDAVQRATGTNGPISPQEKAPTGAENGAIRLAAETYQTAPDCTDERPRRMENMKHDDRPNALTGGTFRAGLHRSASPCAAHKSAIGEAHWKQRSS